LKPPSYDLLGFGTNAVSSVSGHVITNTQSRIKYQSLIKNGVIPCSISRHDGELDCARPLILRLPYHGIIEKNKVSWNKINRETLSRFAELLENKLIEESENSFKVTKLGWYWYVNMMYYMMPKPDQMIMNRMVVDRLKTPGREFERSELFFFDNKTNA
jgi:coproporphyrinogen III oxidase-like Fe-S oxidoreductase